MTTSLHDVLIAAKNQNDNSSVAKYRIYLTPDCRFEVVCCLEISLRKLSNLDLGGTPEGPFFTKGPENSLAGSIQISIKAEEK